ncbi:hypothetical protein FEM48_Zijuj10G0018100 [Ziziphus jujuba var. spinosa]|uniref:Uncharacterized protein n=1 Tax=Ziziphus jujuba var. spinosa TaxID=714518 RepID=A0A978UKK7_ZIZJJ|nr:hypothetical protein FEM48_Zijuj10G0018100 [Ziziphus jujuba var. spinosa]
MYVTRPLSMYRRHPDTLTLPPSDGPNSGYLVILDDEAVTTTYGDDTDDVAIIPVVNQPLSLNREAWTNSREEDMGTNFFGGRHVKDVKPKPLDPSDLYKQVEIIPKKPYCFSAKAVTSDEFSTGFLRNKNRHVNISTPRHYRLNEALGPNYSLRAHFPNFDFPLLNGCSANVIVGKWYCPFMFVKEETLNLKDQMKKSMFYEMTLEQRWEKIFSCDNDNNNEKNVVFVDVDVQTEKVYHAGREAVLNEREVSSNGVLEWFMSFDGAGNESRVGLSMLVVERIKWEEERVGGLGWEEKKNEDSFNSLYDVERPHYKEEIVFGPGMTYEQEHPDTHTLPPSDGPNSGYLVILDDEAMITTCFGWCDENSIRELPFPQNQDLTIDDGDDTNDVAIIPVVNQPLSLNRYYVIQLEIIPKKPYCFSAKAVTSDGFPTGFLRNKNRHVNISTPSHYRLNEALGPNYSLRAHFPNFDFPLLNGCSANVIVGKWYCPFMFVKEATLNLKDQMKKSMFYEMTLEQRWEKIFSCDNDNNNEKNVVFVDVDVQTEKVYHAEREAVLNEREVSSNGVL